MHDDCQIRTHVATDLDEGQRGVSYWAKET